MRHSRFALLAAGLVLATACDEQPAALDQSDLDPQLAKYGTESFRTSAPAQAVLAGGVAGEIVALASAGDVMPGSGRKLVGTPDGIGSWGGGRYMNSYVNHEISLSNGGSYVSKFVIDTKTGTIIYDDYTIDQQYNRLCSASWQDAGDGFPGGYFFTGEESSDGIQLAIDAQGNVTEMPWVGYYAHEQQISVPGFKGYTVIANFDDDGTSGPDLSTEDAESELYMYVASNSWGALNGEGQLYVFSSDEAGNVGDMAIGGLESITGEWIPVPEDVALNLNGDVDGKPELDSWVDDPAHDAFDFTRLEDGFYDKVSAREGGDPAMYFFDTGDPTLGDADYWDYWGAIYRMEWQDLKDPTGPTTLSLLARSEGPGSGWASPDNGDMNADGVIMLQEDRAASGWTRDEAHIYAFQRASDGSLMNTAGQLIATTNGSDCLDDTPGVSCWETSGIEDASKWFGSNSWIFDVQSKTLPPDLAAACPECIVNGQLLIMKVGGDFGFEN